jgi:Putative beta barrel porin-7 (BBP7)
VRDTFSTTNQFYGGQIGAQVQYSIDHLFVGAIAKVGIGSTRETLTVDGLTNVYPVNGAPLYYSGGNYATLQTGRYTTNRFAVMPQLQLNLGYQFTPFVRGTVGYNFMYLSQVLRPGNQIDNVYDGFSRPYVPMNNSSFWTQGINIGLNFSY